MSAARCDHGFLHGLCVESDCWAWDGSSVKEDDCEQGVDTVELICSESNLSVGEEFARLRAHRTSIRLEAERMRRFNARRRAVAKEART